MFFENGPVNGAQLGARRVEIGAGREAAEELGHPVHPAGHHRRRQMVRARHGVRDNLRFGRIGYRRFQNADNGCRARAEPDGPAEHGRIALERVRPEAVGEDGRARGARAVVARIEQPTEDRVQSHHLEIRAADDPGAHHTRLSEADHREADRREVAERAERLDALAQILDLRHRERGVLDADAARALPDVDEARLVAVDERTQEDAADDAEDRGVRADAEGQRQDDRRREPFRTHEESECEFQFMQHGGRYYVACAVDRYGCLRSS